MSLVYDALRTPADAVDRLPPQAAMQWRQSLATHRRPALWLLAGVLVAGPLGFGLAQRAARGGAEEAVAMAQAGTAGDARLPSATAAGSLQEAPAPATPVESDPVPAPMVATVDPAPAAQPDTTVVVPPTDRGDTAATPADAMPAAVPAAQHTLATTAPAPAVPAAPATPAPPVQEGPRPAEPQIQLTVQRRDSATAGTTPAPATPGAIRTAARGADTDPEADNGAAVRQAMAALHAAVGDGDTGATAAAITRLQALLPAESLTLLRAHAWAAHGGGDLAEAERLYRAILDRVPDDEHAGVNLALLDARRGEMDEARARLGRMAARNSRSTQVVQALAELDAAPR